MPTNRTQFNVLFDENVEQWVKDSADARQIKPSEFLRLLVSQAAQAQGVKVNPAKIHHGRQKSAHAANPPAPKSLDIAPEPVLVPFED